MAAHWLLTAVGYAVIVLWIYVIFMLLKIGDEVYGGKYTEVLPPAVAAYTMFLVIELIEHPFTSFVLGGETPLAMVFSLQTMQVLGGIFLILTMQRIYSVDFATMGFTAQEGDS